MRLGCFGSFDDLFLAGFRPAVGDVLAYRAAEEDTLLKRYTNASTQVVHGDLAHINAIDQHSAFDPSKEELAQIAELFLSLLAGQDLRIAVVVSKLVHYGIGRMVEALAGTQGDRFRVFMEEEEARAWLAGDQS